MSYKKSFFERKFRSFLSLGAIMCFAPVNVNAGLIMEPDAPLLKGFNRGEVAKIVLSLGSNTAANVGQGYIHYKNVQFGGNNYKQWTCFLVAPDLVLMPFIGGGDIAIEPKYVVRMPAYKNEGIQADYISSASIGGSESQEFQGRTGLQCLVALVKLREPISGITPFKLVSNANVINGAQRAMVAAAGCFIKGNSAPIASEVVAGTVNLQSSGDTYIKAPQSDTSNYTKYHVSNLDLSNSLGTPLYIQGENPSDPPRLLGVALDPKKTLNDIYFYRMDALLKNNPAFAKALTDRGVTF